MSQLGRGAHSYDLLHPSLPARNAESSESFKQSRDLTRLAILPPGGPQEKIGLPQTLSPVSGPCLADMQGESSHYPTSPCRPRRFACDFGYAGPSQKFPSPPETIHITSDAEVIRSGWREWDEHTGRMPELLKQDEPGNPVHGNDTNTGDEDSLDSVDSSMCSALFREVGLMVGMTDLDDRPFRGSPVLSEFPPCTMDHHHHQRSTARNLSLLTPPRRLRTASGTQFIKFPIGSPKNLNHPSAPLTYASLASRPADSARNKQRFSFLDVIQEQAIAGDPDRNTLLRHRGSEKVGHNHWDEYLLADDEMDLRSNKDTANIHMHPRESVSLPAARSSALDKLGSGLSRLRARSPYQLQKAHSMTGASIGPPKSSEIKRRPSLPPDLNRDPVRQITVLNGRRFPRSPGLSQPLRSVADDAASAVAAFPTTTPPQQSRIRSSGEPMKYAPTPQQEPPRQPRPNSLRKQPSDSRIKKFVRSASRLRRRISSWGKGTVMVQQLPPGPSPPTPHTLAASRRYYAHYSVPIGF